MIAHNSPASILGNIVNAHHTENDNAFNLANYELSFKSHIVIALRDTRIGGLWLYREDIKVISTDKNGCTLTRKVCCISYKGNILRK